MKESFLHYIWQLQYFDKTGLTTSDGEAIEVFKTGILNTHSGADFQSAKIKIGSIEWAGSIELHVNASEWNEHNHFQDPAYDNVILHVVWINDKPVVRADGTVIPTLELKGRVGNSLLDSYHKLIGSSHSIACHRLISQVDKIVLLSMMDAALAQRLETKAESILAMVRKNQNDWEQTAYELLAKNFGFKVNAEPFQQLAQCLPLKHLQKHSDSAVQVEAMLFGQAGFLELEMGDDYYQLLRREYTLLRNKFSFSMGVKKSQWKFLRLRPANFPTIRLAQFAQVICSVKNIFTTILEAQSKKQLRSVVSKLQSPYWTSHYQFNKKSNATISAIGEISVDNIVINTVAPLLAAYGQFTGNQLLLDKATTILMEVKPETNSIIKKWNALEVKPLHAHDSQALIELYTSFCVPKNCLTCRIGNSIIRPTIA
jgi:hypothetical protein